MSNLTVITGMLSNGCWVEITEILSLPSSFIQWLYDNCHCYKYDDDAFNVKSKFYMYNRFKLDSLIKYYQKKKEIEKYEICA